MAITAAQLMVKIGADTGGADKAMQSVSQRLGEFGKQAAMTGTLLTAGVTLPLVGVAKRALDTAMDYQSSLNMMQAVSGATGEQMAAVAKRAKELGADMSLPATSAGDAAKAMTELAKAGLSVENSLAAAKGVLQLAAAGHIKEAQAAEIAANALNAFHLSGDQATRVADLLAAAANASSGEVTDMADSLKMSAAVFASAGIPIEELVASIGQMANAGIKGSDAGTSLKQMLLSLQAPTNKAQKLMGTLGINIYDAQGQMLPFGEIIGQFSTKLGGLSQEQRNAALATIFGSDAVRAANIVMMGGVDVHKQMLDAVTRQGAASELAGARMKGLGGALEGLKSQIETVLLEVAEPFLGVLEGLARSLADLVPKLSEIDPNIRNAALAFAAVLAAAGPVLLVIGGLATAIAFLLSPIGLVVLAVAAFAAAYASNFGGIRDITNAIVGQVVAWLGRVVAWVQQNWPLIQATITDVFTQVQNVVQTVLTTIQNVIQTVMDIISRVWTEHGDGILTKATEIWNGVQVAIQAVINEVVPFITRMLGVVVAWVQENWPLIQKTIETVMNFIANVIDFVLGQILSFWRGHGDQIMGIVSAVWNIVQTVVETAIRTVLDTIKLVMQIITGDWEGAWETLKGIVDRIWQAILKISREWIDILKNALSLAWDGIKAVAELAWNGIVSVVKGAVNLIISAINGIIQAWNRLDFRIPGFGADIPSVEVPGIGRIGGGHLGWPGIEVGTPDIAEIPMLASGGIISRPTLALLGEAGPEAVVPLNRAAAGGGTSITINVHGSVITETELVERFRRELLLLKARNVTTGF